MHALYRTFRLVAQASTSDVNCDVVVVRAILPIANAIRLNAHYAVGKGDAVNRTTVMGANGMVTQRTTERSQR